MDEDLKQPSQPSQEESPTRNPAIAVLGFAVYLLFVPALLFLSAGTLRWPMAWVYTTLLLLSTIGSRLVVLFKHPELMHEQGRFTEAEDTPTWDRILFLRREILKRECSLISAAPVRCKIVPSMVVSKPCSLLIRASIPERCLRSASTGSNPGCSRMDLMS